MLWFGTVAWQFLLRELPTTTTRVLSAVRCRARTTMEAIMWHGNKKSDARLSVEKFRELSKADRDAIVEFLDAI